MARVPGIDGLCIETNRPEELRAVIRASEAVVTAAESALPKLEGDVHALLSDTITRYWVAITELTEGAT